MKVFTGFAVGPLFLHDDHLVSYAGLVPVMTLAEQTGLAQLVAQKVRITAPRISRGLAEPGTETDHADRGHVRGPTASTTSMCCARAA